MIRTGLLLSEMTGVIRTQEPSIVSLLIGLAVGGASVFYSRCIVSRNWGRRYKTGSSFGILLRDYRLALCNRIGRRWYSCIYVYTENRNGKIHASQCDSAGPFFGSSRNSYSQYIG